MPRIPPFGRPATDDDLAAVPDISVAELVGGELHATPRPKDMAERDMLAELRERMSNGAPIYT